MTGTPPDGPHLRRNRNFQLLWLSQSLSQAGTKVASLAAPLVALSVFDSAELAGAVTFAALAPAALVQLHAGVVVDRADRRQILVLAETGRTIVLLSLVLALATGNVHLAHLLVVLGLDGVLSVVSRLAERATLPLVVEANLLSKAYSLNEARLRAATLLGPVIAGALVGVATFAPFLFYAIATGVSALLCLALRGSLRDGAQQRQTYGREIRSGYEWLRGNPFFWWTAWILLATNTIGIAFPLVVILRLEGMGSSPGQIGLVLAALGAGGLLGLIVAPRVAETIRPARVFALARWVMAFGLLGAFLAPTPLLLAAALPPISIAASISNVSMGVARLDAIPPPLRARVDSLSTLIANTLAPCGALAAGFLAGGMGASRGLLVLGLAMLCTAAVTTAVPVVSSGGPPARSTSKSRAVGV